jgi:hypothetical protein
MCCFRSLAQLRRILSEKAETVEALDNVMFHLQVSNLSTLRKQAFANTAQPLSAFPFLAEQVCLRAYGPALETQNNTKYETK